MISIPIPTNSNRNNDLKSGWDVSISSACWPSTKLPTIFPASAIEVASKSDLLSLGLGLTEPFRSLEEEKSPVVNNS